MSDSQPSDTVKKSESKPTRKLPVAGIGASAGGVEALQSLFSALPNNTGVAFVVIIHLSPEHESHLPSILANVCQMPVLEVQSITPLEPDHIYVISPGRELKITDTHVDSVAFKEARGHRSPIDTFFQSLAEKHGDGFAIILSGNNSDGANGAKAIKNNGGLVLVQEPAEAPFDAMPRATIATGVADFVLPVRELAVRLAELSITKRRVHQRFDDSEGQQLVEADELALKNLLAHLRMRTGHDFSPYKRATVLRRIARRMQVNDFESLESYVEFVRQNVEEAQALFDDMLITVTTFFRDADAWQALADQIIPELFEGRPEGQPIRAWVPGCATGEEAYTLTMLLTEEAERRERWPEIQVFASDLDEGALATARIGRFPASITADVSKERLQRFFIREDDHFRISKELRERVLFASHSLLADPPFTRLDLVSCRNLLIYLGREAQKQAFDIFRYALVPGGFLLLGSAESANVEQFESLDKRHRLFRVLSSGKTNVPDVSLNARTNQSLLAPPLSRPHYNAEAVVEYADIQSLVPPSVLVDEHFETVRLLGGVGRYMEPADGASPRSLVDLVRPELRMPLHSALYKAFAQAETSLSEPLRVSLDGAQKEVSIWVRPRQNDELPLRALVVFVENNVDSDNTGTAISASHSDKQQDLQIQEALQLSEGRWREARIKHETTTEELRASNEELQSVNEEYRSTTEELETSKEELQSINEELNTVNAELRVKFEEVSQAHDDLANLMAATDIGTLFLDRQLQIKRFTPALSELFNVKIEDLGRPIADFTNRLDYQNLLKDAKAVLASLAPLEREARHDDGRIFVVQLRPYRTVEDRIVGVVVTFIDTTARLVAERALMTSEARLKAVLESLPAVVPFATDAQGCISYIGPSIREYAGLEPATLLDTVIHSSLVHPDDQAHSEAAWIEAREQGKPYDMRHRLRMADGSYRWTITRARPVEKENSEEVEWFGAITDVDELTGVETTLREADRHRNRFIGLLGHELRNPLASIKSSLHVLTTLSTKEGENQDDNSGSFVRTVDILERQCQHMTRLVNDLLDLTRINNGKIELQLCNVSLADSIEEIIDIMRPRIQEAELSLNVHLPDTSLCLRADPDRLAQMLGNLLDNAVKYSEAGGKIEVVAVRKRQMVIIVVRDNGIGIAPEALPTLFQPFTQILNSSGSKRDGLGLGLTLVQNLVELHHGSIEARSEGLNKGSEFRLRLPLIDQPVVAGLTTDVERRKKAKTLSRRRILVVDDSHDVADPFAALLRVMNQQVQTAYDGDAALKAAAEFKPDVAILDLGMPGMDGFELAKRLRRQFPKGTLVLIALTGYSQPEDLVKSEQAGFDHHLIKPIQLDALREILGNLDD